MKKISIFLVIVLLISLFALQAGATEETRVHAGRHCVCGGSAVEVEDHVCNNLPWKRLPEGTTDFSQLANGNYYLTGDVTVTQTVTNGTDSPWKDKKLNLCLNGYDISTEAGSVFGYVDLATINICDCTGTQDAQGNWQWDGTITANRVGKTASYGGIINIRANTLVNIYGGNFVGATGAKAGGIFNVCHDGFGANGLTYASNTDPGLFTKLTVYNGHFSGGSVSGNGGLINAWHTADVHIYGGTFSGGSAQKGGNLYLASGDNMVKNCTITGGTATVQYGNFYVPTGTVNLSNAHISGGSPEVAYTAKGGKYLKGYTDLGEAFTAAKDTSNIYVQLVQDAQTDLTVTGTVYLDMNGCDLSGVTIEGTLYGIDSSTNGYYGSNAGILTPASGVPQRLVKTTANQTGNIYRYLRVEEQGGYSFHRFYIGITGAVLSPDRSGFGLKATFAGDDRVKAVLSQKNAFGMVVSLNPTADSLDSGVVRSLGAPLYRAGVPFSKRTVIYGILDTEDTILNNIAHATTEIYGQAFIRLDDGTVLFSQEVSRNLREMVEGVNENWDSYTSSQKNAVDGFLKDHEFLMSSWNVANIHHHDTTKWKPWPENNKWVSGGHYYLTHDLTEKTQITIAAGQTLDICLNGFDIQGVATASRLLQIKGTLTVHDHCDENGDYAGDIVTNYTGYGMGPLFYVYENAVFNLCGGNLKAADGVVSTRGGVGMIGNGNDNNDYAYMNMYNGTISGGSVLASWDPETKNFVSAASGCGGNVDMIGYSVLNLYDGVISGGKAMYALNNGEYVATKNNGLGGNLCLPPHSVLNMYGGTITGGYTASVSSGTGLGGNIYSSGGEVNLLGGTVSNGTAEGGRGGNIFTTATLTLKDTTVTGGTATARDGDLNSGLGDGIYTTSSVTLGGKTVIKDNTGHDVFLAEKATMDGAELTDGACVGVTGHLHGRVSTNPNTAPYFFSNHADYTVAAVNRGVSLVPKGVDTGLVDTKPASFSVGYSMTDISPKEDGLIMSSYGNPNGRLSKGLDYPLYATTIAVTDQDNNTFLMITVDLQNSPVELFEEAFQRISQVTGVPAENIYVSSTHTHNVPTITTSSAGNKRYLYQFMDALIRGAVTAMEDRAPATMQTGSFDTQGMNYSRHYYYADPNGKYTDAQGNKISYFGDQFGTPPTDKSLIKRVEPGDETMHMIAFQRTGRAPVLVVNWRAHPHRSGGKESYTVTADVIGALREYIHANTSYQFAFFQGAAGNMNTSSRISGETYKSGKVKEYGDELGRQIVDNGLPKLKDTPTGKVQATKIIYAAPVDHSEDGRYEEAVELNNYYKNYPDLMDTYEEQIAKATEMGFSSVFHAQRLIKKYGMDATYNLELNIFSIGDSVGFYTGPGEFWDSVSEEMEERSPFGTTFCLGYSNGNVAYIPYKISHYSSYEYHYCLFTQDDTVMKMMDIYEENLKKFYNAVH